MESQPQNPEFRNNPENFHPCMDPKYSVIKWLRYTYLINASGSLQNYYHLILLESK